MARSRLFDSSESQYVQTVRERIKQLRLNMLVHSFIYYELNDSLISDHEWQRRADELTALQAKYPANIGSYDEAFKDWDGSTGYHLPADYWVRNKADQLLQAALRRRQSEQPSPRRRLLVQDDQPIQRRPTRKAVL